MGRPFSPGVKEDPSGSETLDLLTGCPTIHPTLACSSDFRPQVRRTSDHIYIYLHLRILEEHSQFKLLLPHPKPPLKPWTPQTPSPQHSPPVQVFQIRLPRQPHALYIPLHRPTHDCYTNSISRPNTSTLTPPHQPKICLSFLLWSSYTVPAGGQHSVVLDILPGGQMPRTIQRQQPPAVGNNRHTKKVHHLQQSPTKERVRL